MLYGDNYYIVQSGEYQVFVKASGGESVGEKPVATIKAGGGFGELALLFNSPRSAPPSDEESSELSDDDSFELGGSRSD